MKWQKTNTTFWYQFVSHNHVFFVLCSFVFCGFHSSLQEDISYQFFEDVGNPELVQQNGTETDSQSWQTFSTNTCVGIST